MIITLCGSNRFEKHFKAWNRALTFAGHCVFSVSVYPSDAGKKDWYTPEEKEILDMIHKEKIRHSDAIFLINPFSYIGESTLGEIEFARRLSKKLYSLESWGRGNGIGSVSAKPATLRRAQKYGVPKDFRSPIDTTTSSGFQGYWSSSLFGAGASELRSKLMDYLQEEKVI